MTKREIRVRRPFPVEALIYKPHHMLKRHNMITFGKTLGERNQQAVKNSISLISSLFSNGDKSNQYSAFTSEKKFYSVVFQQFSGS